MKRMKRPRAVVIGCGALGAHMASRLDAAGYAITAVDVDGFALRRLSLLHGVETVEGDGTDLGVLREAKTAAAELLLATTLEDNANLMIAQMAKAEFGVQRVWARVRDPERESLCRRFGVEPICPPSVAADVALQAITEEGGP